MGRDVPRLATDMVKTTVRIPQRMRRGKWTATLKGGWFQNVDALAMRTKFIVGDGNDTWKEYRRTRNKGQELINN